MTLNLNQLRIFFVCGRHSTFSEAANTLCLSQPAVTIQIKQLEAYCGMELFHHHKKRLELTDAGKVLFEHAEKLFQVADAADNAIKAVKTRMSGTVRIGAVKIYARFMVRFLVSTFQERHPGMRLIIEEGNSALIISNLMNRKNEVGLIMMATPFHPELETILYGQEELFLLLPSDHPLNHKRKIRIEDLANVPLVVREKDSVARNAILARYKEANIEPGATLEVENLASIIDHVHTGEGISFIAEWAFASEQVHANEGISLIAEWALREQISRGSLKIRPLHGSPLLISVVIAYKKNEILSPAAQAFIDLLLEKRKLTEKSLAYRG
jgi:LysR family transcriptional regulator, low CO2-responsive transcriptional regulator